MDWTAYESRINVSGADGRARAITREKEAILRKSDRSPSLKEVVANGTAMKLFINSTDAPSEKTFNTLPGELVNIGDIFLWNEMHWLVTKIDFDDEVTRKGRIVQCNRQIRWQNPKTGEIVERWCLATKPYTSNIDAGAVVSTSNREYKIQIPYDDETRMVDIDKRFLLEKVGKAPKAYTVTSVDTLTNRYEDIDGGFLIWNLTQGEYNPERDNAELMIADYMVPGEVPSSPPPVGLLPCSISGKGTIRCGMKRTYTATFYLADGTTEDSSVTAVWTVTPPAGYESAVTWQANGNFMELTIASDESIAGQAVALSVTDQNGVYAPSEFRVEVTGAYG